MRLSIVVAMDAERTIGRDGTLPWHLPEDLKRFRRLTWGKPIVMGRRTHESIGRVLPGRENIVLTRQQGWEAPGCTVVNSLDEALAAAAGAEEVMIVGGAEIYREALPRADRLYVTEVQAAIGGDVHFPDYDAGEWVEVERDDHAPDERHAHPYSFRVLDRISAGADPSRAARAR